MGMGSQCHALATLFLERQPVPTAQEAEQAPRLVWTGAKISPPLEFDPWTAGSRYTDYTILAHKQGHKISQVFEPNKMLRGKAPYEKTRN
jgi:hypothetical protein